MEQIKQRYKQLKRLQMTGDLFFETRNLACMIQDDNPRLIDFYCHVYLKYLVNDWKVNWITKYELVLKAKKDVYPFFKHDVIGIQFVENCITYTYKKYILDQDEYEPICKLNKFIFYYNTLYYLCKQTCIQNKIEIDTMFIN